MNEETNETIKRPVICVRIVDWVIHNDAYLEILKKHTETQIDCYTEKPKVILLELAHVKVLPENTCTGR